MQKTFDFIFFLQEIANGNMSDGKNISRVLSFAIGCFFFNLADISFCVLHRYKSYSILGAFHLSELTGQTIPIV